MISRDGHHGNCKFRQAPMERAICVLCGRRGQHISSVGDRLPHSRCPQSMDSVPHHVGRMSSLPSIWCCTEYTKHSILRSTAQVSDLLPHSLLNYVLKNLNMATVSSLAPIGYLHMLNQSLFLANWRENNYHGSDNGDELNYNRLSLLSLSCCNAGHLNAMPWTEDESRLLYWALEYCFDLHVHLSWAVLTFRDEAEFE